MAYQNNYALNMYQSLDVEGSMTDANPHRVIQLLMQGGLDRIGEAKNALMRRNIAGKAQAITYAVRILQGLRASLNHHDESSQEIAKNLDALYEYMIRRLAEANAHNDIKVLDEVKSLLMQIKSAWDAIGQHAR